MEAENLKKRLRKIAVYKQELKLKLDWYTDMIRDYSPYKSPSGNEGEGNSNQISDTTYAAIINREKLVKKFEKEIETICSQLDMVIDEFDGYMQHLNEKERLIMTCRYMCGMSWRRVAKETYYHDKYVENLHATAIKKIVANNNH